jgi:predicted nucleotidyltransferase
LGLWDELEDLLGRKVDLLTEQALKPGIRERIVREAVALWPRHER